MHNHLQPGDILHCWRNTFLSKAIRFATRSRFSHTALFVVLDGEPFIIDAQNDGVQLRPFYAWINEYKYKFIVTRQPNDFQSYKFITKRRALSKIGTTGYDFESLIIRFPYKLITGKWKVKSNEDERMCCGEFVMWVYQVAESYKMSPEDAYIWTIENQFTIISNDTLFSCWHNKK